jgi:hypothetical protein
MIDPSDALRILIPAAGITLLFLKHREVAEALENFRNNFPRGGPPRPMHPSPVTDGALLRRRRASR